MISVTTFLIVHAFLIHFFDLLFIFSLFLQINFCSFTVRAVVYEKNNICTYIYIMVMVYKQEYVEKKYIRWSHLYRLLNKVQ